MYSLIWQSVMWRPGKMRFLIGVKNRLHIQPAAIARSPPVPGGRCRWIRDFSRAAPSLRRKPSDAFSS
jgi:hypothetical protein